MTTYPIADYITLYMNEATTTFATGLLKWSIPPSTYLSNTKGQYCLVSIADAGLSAEPYDLTLGLVLSDPKPLNNGSNSPILASFSVSSYDTTAEDSLHTLTLNNVKYLISARPSSITLQGVDSANNFLLFTAGWVTLKFEYLSKTSVNEINNESEYNTF